MVLRAVRTHSDMIGRGLVLNGGLVTRCESLISPILVLTPRTLGAILFNISIYQLLKP